MDKVTLKAKFAVLIGAILLLCLGINLAWQTQTEANRTEQTLLRQARSLSSNMDAVWEFMTINQKLINYDSEGNYDFKGLQCSIAGRSIGSLFSQRTGQETHYVSATPRNESDLPDDFEANALAIFEADPSLEEYFQIDETETGTFFRYLAPMKMEENCLTCHGKPAGTIDETGYPREGLSVGDLYGAYSLSIPMEPYENAAKESTKTNITFSAILIVACLATMYIALTVLVTKPFGRLRRAISSIEKGDLASRVKEMHSSAEANDMARGFNAMAEQLERAYENLEEQVADRTHELKHANNELEKQRRALQEVNQQLIDDNQFKSDFLAMMSHELRTPLAASMAFSGILEERHPAENEEEAHLWREIETNNKTLLSLINNILEMARIDAGKEQLHLSLVDIGDVVGMLQASVEPLAHSKGLSMEYLIDEHVPLFAADPDKLRRIIENLASNAIKFTPEGGQVSIAIRHDDARKLVVFEVRDTGIGIPKKSLDLVFDRFTQIDSSAERIKGGSGLGLALVKELTEMHGGSVGVSSELGAGSVFTVKIPSNLKLGD